MPKVALRHNRLLTENFRENNFWPALTNAMDKVINPVIQAPTEKLGTIRSPDVEPYYAALNVQNLGFNVPSLSFNAAEYRRLMQSLGIYWQTCGSSTAFIRFLSYIKNVNFIYTALWANSLDMPINQLTGDYGTEVWNGGPWFPTAHFDVLYSLVEFPDVDENQFRDFIYKLAPMHLTLRSVIGIDATTAEIYMTAIPLDRQRDIAVARPF